MGFYFSSYLIYGMPNCPCKTKLQNTWNQFCLIYVRLVIWLINNLFFLPRLDTSAEAVDISPMRRKQSLNIFSLQPINLIDWRLARQNKLLREDFSRSCYLMFCWCFVFSAKYQCLSKHDLSSKCSHILSKELFLSTISFLNYKIRQQNIIM